METWFRLPRELRAVLCGAAACSFAFLAFLAWDFDRLYNGNDGSRIVGWLVLAALIGLVVTVLALGTDEAFCGIFGSIDQFITYNRGLRTGELPAHIDPGVWRAWLTLSRGANRMAQLLAYALVLFVVVPSLTHQPAYHPVAMALFGVLVSWRLVCSWRKRACITRLADEVEQHAGAHMTPEEAEQETWFRMPLAVRIILGAAVGFSLAFGVAYLDRLYNGDKGSLVGLLAWAAFVGLVLAIRMVVGNEGCLRRNIGSFDHYIAYTRALRTGEVPANIDPDVWRGRLSSSLRSNRMESLWASFLVVFAVLPSLIDQSAYWVTASLFGLLAIRNFVSWWLMRVRITRLAAEVERHTPRGSTV